VETYLTPEELSKALKISRVWVYKLCDQGRIPFFRLAGKVIRFDAQEIKKWMEESRGEKYRRDKGNEKEGAKGRGPAGLCTSTGG
jgi:excisionase family DNA binding protein